MDDLPAGRFSPLPKVLDYPIMTGLTVEVVSVVILLLVAKRFDPSHGSLTVSLLIIVAFIALAVYASIFTIPADEETATIIGGLVAAFGAVVAFWIGRSGDGGNRGDQPPGRPKDPPEGSD